MVVPRQLPILGRGHLRSGNDHYNGRLRGYIITLLSGPLQGHTSLLWLRDLRVVVYQALDLFRCSHSLANDILRLGGNNSEDHCHEADSRSWSFER